MAQWFFEDMEPGKTIEVGSCTVSEQEIVAFAREYDPQPFHVDAAAAAKSIHGGLIASGWHTCSLMQRLIADGFLNHTANLGSPGLNALRWLKPVRGGDTLTVEVSITDRRPSASKPDRGLVFMSWQGRNQHRETVVTIQCMAMFLRRPKQRENAS